MRTNRTNLAPVALFVYNRLSNTKQVIEALRNNHLATSTDLYIFSDAPKTEKDRPAVEKVRRYLKTIGGFKSVSVIERLENFYIERNIIDGVTSLINQFGRIIVLEDDGVTAKNFLTFMNQALDYYEPYERVMHIATFTFIKLPNHYRKTFLWRYSENTGGGWATWKRAWSKFRWFQNEQEGLDSLTESQKQSVELDGAFKCLSTLKMKPIPWDICWYMAIAKHNGLAVNSPRALTKNNGLFNGTHFTIINRLLGQHHFEVELDTDENITLEDNLVENPQAIELLKDFYANVGKRKRDKILRYFIRVLVWLKITKLVKRLCSK